MYQKELIKPKQSMPAVVFAKVKTEESYTQSTKERVKKSPIDIRKLALPILGLLLIGSIILNLFVVLQPQALGLQPIRYVGTQQGQNLALQFNELISSSELAVRKIVDVNLVRQENPEAAIFYENAQAEDVLFVYTKLGIALLYRPSTLQVINVAKISDQLQTN